ncbi:hypothetical protein [Streptomyces sp. NPDC006134]|uniref:hypothetical protein n=1 Tax=Streptomyces sp. NPDC006134 TaxID=3154467 RepID=UPI0034024823
MSLFYCQRWNNRFDKPIKQITAEEAERRHRAGEPYAVAPQTGDSARADRSIELALRSGHVRVYFYDEYGRVSFLYIFSPRGEKLFLGGIVSYDYGEAAEYLGMSQSVRVQKDEYWPEGTGLRTVQDERTGESFQQELFLAEGQSFDDYWEQVPAFGDYASIARAERSKPPIPFG